MKKYILLFVASIISSTASADAFLCQNNKLILENPPNNGFKYEIVLNDFRQIKPLKNYIMSEPQNKDNMGFMSYCSEKESICLPAQGSIFLDVMDGKIYLGKIRIKNIPNNPFENGQKEIAGNIIKKEHPLC